jgi:hypothetical protein
VQFIYTVIYAPVGLYREELIGSTEYLTL